MSDTNWITDHGTNILIGLKHLPTPIKKYMAQSISNRPAIKHVYHVTELLYCLRKAYFRRIKPRNNFDTESLWNIYRGSTFDRLWSPLFTTNQRTYQIEREHITITGTLDFVWVDERTIEKVLYDLKMPKNVYYKKKEGAGKFYIEQVQSYLAMAHQHGELLDVHRCRVMMLADDLVIDEVPENNSILEYLWTRAFSLDEALMKKDSSLLRGPEDKIWECNEKYCDADVEYRIECAEYPLL